MDVVCGVCLVGCVLDIVSASVRASVRGILSVGVLVVIHDDGMVKSVVLLC